MLVTKQPVLHRDPRILTEIGGDDPYGLVI